MEADFAAEFHAKFGDKRQGWELTREDEVILLGEADSGARITAEDFADWTGTNEYEVMTNISARVPRVFVKE